MGKEHQLGPFFLRTTRREIHAGNPTAVQDSDRAKGQCAGCEPSFQRERILLARRDAVRSRRLCSAKRNRSALGLRLTSRPSTTTLPTVRPYLSVLCQST